MRPRLKLYTGDQDCGAVEEPQVKVRLGEVCAALADATRFRRTWLSDFEDDEIQVSEDLYEVLAAYWQLRPGA
ncbi:hypothetical protein [Rubinisphaera margarita]|uniref:hypothetical protein n=1 Tax=Rubinisphaera margarita TaxID=2909586 RepID=UPI001EE982FB|nr:hypothetical protein [Rubinisphaera margarita]MCG6154792.1 hypothetical protein [Rubinisphaera margarita]